MTSSTPTDATPILLMEHATIASHLHPDRSTVEDVTWTVRPDDFWIVGGLLGSGKTDLLYTAAALQPPVRGLCRIFGHDCVPHGSPPPLPERLRLGMVFEGGQLLTHLSLADNIALPIRYHRHTSEEDCAAQVQSLLDFAGLQEVAHRSPGEVSLVWRRRAGLARALALQPDILLVDNPLSGLDPRQAIWWRQCLTQLSAGHPVRQNQKITLIVTGTNLTPWRPLARQFAILTNGRFLACPDGADDHAAGDLNEQLVGTDRDLP